MGDSDGHSEDQKLRTVKTAHKVSGEKGKLGIALKAISVHPLGFLPLHYP
jgi:hypothetical protein